MSDLIRRQDAIDVVRKWFDKIELNGDICIDGIISLPTVRPKTGTWIKRPKGALGYICTACGKSDVSNKFDYCPNCGAKMKEGEAE